jgi:FKBP-type peptidyl-prolyl cis-trans isomerase
MQLTTIRSVFIVAFAVTVSIGPTSSWSLQRTPSTHSSSSSWPRVLSCWSATSSCRSFGHKRRPLKYSPSVVQQQQKYEQWQSYGSKVFVHQTTHQQSHIDNDMTIIRTTDNVMGTSIENHYDDKTIVDSHPHTSVKRTINDAVRENGRRSVLSIVFAFTTLNTAYPSFCSPLIAKAATTTTTETTAIKLRPIAMKPTLVIDIISKPNEIICSKIQSRTNDLLEFYYEAWVGNNENGRIYDSSQQRGTEGGSSLSKGRPYAYVLGSGDIIPGVDQGLYNMCLGEIRTITIPPVLGYGSTGINLYKIPPYTNLFWKIELVSINFITANDDRTRDDL